VDECKPLVDGIKVTPYRAGHVLGRALHSFTLELNLSGSRTLS
jgi:Cft2 family RNA processing exonuclease